MGDTLFPMTPVVGRAVLTTMGLAQARPNYPCAVCARVMRLCPSVYIHSFFSCAKGTKLNLLEHAHLPSVQESTRCVCGMVDSCVCIVDIVSFHRGIGFISCERALRLQRVRANLFSDGYSWSHYNL